MKNKKLIIGLTVVASISYFGSDLDVKSVPNKELVTKIIKTTETRTIMMRPELRNPAAQSSTSLKKIFNYKGTSHSALPEGFQFAEHIFAVRSSEYKTDLGDKVEERHGFTFFEAIQQPLESNKVVIDQKSKKLFLVSSVIKLENVDKHLRDEIISKGLEEHYYIDELKVMYVQAGQEELLKVHEELQGLKLSPQLELVRSFHKPI